MTQDEADKAQNWLGMDGATAWHLIDRHADDWSEAGELMNAWARAHVLAEREACIEDVRTVGGEFAGECEALILKRFNAKFNGGL